MKTNEENLAYKFGYCVAGSIFILGFIGGISYLSFTQAYLLYTGKIINFYTMIIGGFGFAVLDILLYYFFRSHNFFMKDSDLEALNNLDKSGNELC